jgi:hypothetical protein
MLEKDQYPFLILGTGRSEEAEVLLDLRRALARTGKLSEIKLGGLGETAVVEVIRSHCEERPGEVEFARRLQRATGGNPFYLIEILRQRIEESIFEDPLPYQTEFRIPESIREAIQARLDRLSPLSRQVLEAAAITGQSFDLDLLRLAAGRSDSEILSALDELPTRLLLVGFRGGTVSTTNLPASMSRRGWIWSAVSCCTTGLVAHCRISNQEPMRCWLTILKPGETCGRRSIITHWQANQQKPCFPGPWQNFTRDVCWRCLR